MRPPFHKTIPISFPMADVENWNSENVIEREDAAAVSIADLEANIFGSG